MTEDEVLSNLDRIALELEILNRRAELRTAKRERPVLTGSAIYFDMSDPVNIQSDQNRRYLMKLRSELDACIAKRKTP